jgi:hypothetical protein
MGIARHSSVHDDLLIRTTHVATVSRAFFIVLLTNCLYYRDVSGRRTASFGELKEAKCETAFIGIYNKKCDNNKKQSSYYRRYGTGISCRESDLRFD